MYTGEISYFRRIREAPPPPVILWRPMREHGRFRPGYPPRIFLNPLLPPGESERVLLHEMQHYKQFLRCPAAYRLVASPSVLVLAVLAGLLVGGLAALLPLLLLAGWTSLEFSARGEAGNPRLLYLALAVPGFGAAGGLLHLAGQLTRGLP